MPISLKPAACLGCDLHEKGEGFATADGPANADLLFVGEALGKVEAITGRPFMGDAGGMLTRLFNLLGWTRDAVRIHNVINCRPPNDWFDERAPWYHTAMNHCRYLDESLNVPPKVVVTMGATALKRVLGLQHAKKIRVQDFHGSILRDPTDRYWVVPTYHPSFLQRGAHNLIGTVLWDLLQAIEARNHGKPDDPGQLFIDPPVDQFAAWVEQVVAARRQDPEAYPITSDVETPDKAGGRDEGEITAEDKSFQILRQNVTCHPDEGWTVPNAGPYIPLLQRLYASPGPIWEWNREYDFQRQVAGEFLSEADSGRVVDLMWLAHKLQSDLPRGLGFWAPFYSQFGPWKHLSASDPAKYAAIDAIQNHRIGFGVLTDLIATGMYHFALRHTHQLHTRVLRPAQLIGVKVDRPRLLVFKQQLIDKAREQIGRLSARVPVELQPLTPKGGLTKRPLDNVLHVKASTFTRRGKARAGKPVPEIKQELYAKAVVVEKLILKEVLACLTCGAVEIQRRHKCARLPSDHDPALGGPPPRSPELSMVPATVTRWFWQEPFNPDSPDQVLKYIKFRKHTPGKAKKTHKDSTNKEALERLARVTGDQFYDALLNYRAVNKVKGTYVEGTERRLDSNDRLHPQPTFKPSTDRLSYVNPNITNVVADKGGEEGLAAGFRYCIVASPGCHLVELDFSSIEAVLVGERAGDPTYVRLAKFGVHAGMVSHAINQPYDPAWSDAELGAYLKAIKDRNPPEYDPCKRFIHGRAYGLTLHGMQRQFPHLFPTQRVAERYAAIFRTMAPKVETWQSATQQRAARQHYLGGPGDHPFGSKHWFWSIFTHRRISAAQYYKILKVCQEKGIANPPVNEINGQYFRISDGEDSKRALAFYPQSIAAGILKEAALRLFDRDEACPNYIGDAYFGETPLRAPIHDSLLLEVPDPQIDRVIKMAAQEMQRPIPELPLPPEWGMGEHLAIGVAAKVGLDWKHMQKVKIDEFDPDWQNEPMEQEDEEDWGDLQRVV